MNSFASVTDGNDSLRTLTREATRGFVTSANDEIAFALTELNINDINPYLAIKNEDIVESLLNSNDLDYLIEDINTK